MKKFLFIIVFTAVTSNFIRSQNYTVILGRPTDTSITASILFDQPVEYYIDYGTQPLMYNHSSITYTNTANKPDEIDLGNLLADTKYFYKLHFRTLGAPDYKSSPEYSFHTQRAKGSTFTFTVESDVHLYDKKGVKNEYRICLANQAADQPDFMLDLGDTYGDDHLAGKITSKIADSLHKAYRPFLGSICHSIPYYFCLGNHEGEFNYYLKQTPPNNIAVYSTLWRKYYYAGPEPNGFYSGNTDVEGYNMGNPENYYAWTWGDALFVVLDVYRYQCDTSAKPQGWAWTLGLPQYSWLKNTLENSTAKYKFVFAHHTRGQGRGGIKTAPYFEWGGHEEKNMNNTFTANRPGWAKPIHQLFVDNGVNIFFQGHDHLFAHEILDNVTYQEVPMPSDSTYKIGMLANADAYVSDTIDGSGHLRVTVSSLCVKVDFVRAYLPADTVSGVHKNREVAFSYTIGNCQSVGVGNIQKNSDLRIYPNPAKDKLIITNENLQLSNAKMILSNALGQIVLSDDLSLSANSTQTIDVSGIPNGIYFMKISNADYLTTKKIIIKH